MVEGESIRRPRPAKFEGTDMFRESSADRLARWRSTFRRLGEIMATSTANKEFERMVRRLDGAADGNAG